MNVFMLNYKSKERSIAIHHNYTFQLKDMNDVEDMKKKASEYKEYLFYCIKNKDKWWYRFFKKKRPEWLVIKKKYWNTDIKYFVKEVISALRIYEKKIPYINLMATQYCNLNCKGCGALMPLYNKSKERKFWEVEQLDKVLKRYSEIFNGEDEYLNTIDIVGGEPLLHPNICEFCSTVRKYNPKSKIVIITNGLLLDKMPKEFYEMVLENDINIALSVYGDDIYFEKYNIGYNKENCDEVRCDKCSGHLPIVDYKKRTVSFGGVQLLPDGRLCYCACAGVDKLNECFGTDFKTVENSDWIDIFTHTKEDILEMFQKPYCEFSKYCNKRDLFPWDISKCKSDEWLFL